MTEQERVQRNCVTDFNELIETELTEGVLAAP